MAVKTYAEQLESVQNAIASIEAGAQSLTISGKAYTKADLKTLYDRESWLRRMAGKEARGGGIRVRGITPVDL